MKIGFIGLGHMGQPMAKNLLKAGFALQVYDVVPAAVQALVEVGAIASPTPAAMASTVDVIITSLPSSAHVEAVCCADDGIFTQASPGLLVIDCSSIDVNVTRALHAQAASCGIAMLDAPVSGGVAGAKQGTLTFMVGGQEKDLQRALPVLQAMAKKIVHAGGPGLGQVAKICNNLLLAITMIGTSEAFALAEKLGLAPQKFFDISANASGQCWAMTQYCPVPDVIENVPANRDYQPGFMAKMMLKDLRLAQHAAEAVDAVTPLGSVATELYELFVNQGDGDLDFSAIITLMNGVRPA